MSHNLFVARQAVLDRASKVYGYELLHRSDTKSTAYAARDGSRASTAVMHATLNVVGLTELTGTRRLFVNITRDLLLGEDYMVLPPERTVVELLETVEPDQPVVDACRRLREAGYLLALDDFVFAPQYRALLGLADILKVDFIATSPAQREGLARLIEGSSACLLAEKVESRDDFRHAQDLGYTYFQGYYFRKPQTMGGHGVDGNKMVYLRFLQEVSRPELDYEALAQTVNLESALATKLLRYLNSAAFGLTAKVTSIRQALSLLGARALRKWGSLVALASLGADKPAERGTICLVRARFCELLAGDLGTPEREVDLFLLGLLSALDAMLDQPLSRVLAQVPVAHDVAAALLGSRTRLGKFYGLLLALERGQWALVSNAITELGLIEERVANAYRAAVTWADQVVAA